MHVLATAGHVDHGKSTLVRALTGMEPDRWAEERRRGMTIDLGYAWTTLPSGEQVAFVDVPGHERFVPNMLAGIGPVPAVLVVVAADEGWRAQSEEHLAALDALGVRHGLLVVTRSDLADPAAATEDALARIRRTSLGEVPAVAVSAVTGAGLDELRAALTRLVAALPAPDPAAPVRLWVDRSFTISGAGTVVTGTLPAGTLHGADDLVLAPAGTRVQVRGLQSLGEPRREVSGVARVAVNLRGVAHDDVHRGDALITPGAWHLTREIDVRLSRSWLGDATGGGGPAGPTDRGTTDTGGARARLRDLPEQLVLHVGSAAVTARLRPLSADDTAADGDSPTTGRGEMLRLQLPVALPLHVGDRGLLRDPGLHLVVGAITVLDVAPPALRRRGAAAARARELAGMTGQPDAGDEIRRRGIVSADALRAMGVEPPAGAHRGWYVDDALRKRLATQLTELVTAWAAAHPLEPGLPAEAARQRLRLPDPALVDLLRRDAGLQAQEGRLRAAGAGEQLPPKLESALQALGQDLDTAPFAAPEAGRLAQLGLGPREVAAAVKAGRLLKVADNVVLLAGADVRAAQTLAGLGGPFTVSEARQALGSTRRVVVPLLELLDRRGLTDRLPDDRRVVRASRSA